MSWARRTVITFRDFSMPVRSVEGPKNSLRVVVRPPDRLAEARIDLERRVHHHRGRRVAVVERRGIDERLERRARLAERLGGAVELAFGEGEAADHGQHAAGMRVHRDERALDLRHLLELELAGSPAPFET